MGYDAEHGMVRYPFIYAAVNSTCFDMTWHVCLFICNGIATWARQICEQIVFEVCIPPFPLHLAWCSHFCIEAARQWGWNGSLVNCGRELREPWTCRNNRLEWLVDFAREWRERESSDCADKNTWDEYIYVNICTILVMLFIWIGNGVFEISNARVPVRPSRYHVCFSIARMERS